METSEATSPRPVSAELRQLAERLLLEHQTLMRGLGCHQEWIRQLCEIGMPRFGELACRLEGFRAELARHFQNEEQYGELLNLHDTELGRGKPVQARSASDGAGTDAIRLHAELLNRLSQLIGRLGRGLEEFRGWNVAVGEVGSLVGEICEHERREMDVLRRVTGEGDQATTNRATGAASDDNSIAQ
ncbi:MAG: hypothetical protein RLZZ436_1211 [Planctomycetota bacterium]|jgi:hypothetical protein